MKLYAACEDVDNYYRDGCVFREDVDIYDTMSALVKYSNSVTMNYSLNAAMPFEGYRVAFNGEKGRLEARDYVTGFKPLTGNGASQQRNDVSLMAGFRITAH